MTVPAGDGSAHDRAGHGERWGRAEDGATVRLVGTLGDDEWWWPPTGLARAGEQPTATATLEIRGDRRDPQLLVDGAEQPGGWLRLESDLSLFTAEHLRGRVAVHAAVLAWHGAAIVVPGPSHAGKSTLALAAKDLGAGLLSDEYALVDPTTGHVTGWRRAARRRLPGGAVEQVPLGTPDPGPLPVSLIAALSYDPDSTPHEASIGAPEAARALLANTVSGQRHPVTAFEAALAVARTARAVQGTRGEARDAARRLLGLADHPGRPQP